MYALYRYLTGFLSSALPLYLRRRARRGKEDAERMAERLGHASQSRPEGTLLWLHAASVGEMNATLPLLRALAERLPYVHFLLTTGTVTSAQLAEKRLPPRTIHQFAPVDIPAAAQRFIAHWQPQAALFMESEIWPNLIREAKASDVMLLLINARMSDKSFRLWSHLPTFARFLLSSFDAVYAQSHCDANKFTQLGAQNVQMPGNLKYDAPALPCDEFVLTQLRQRVGDRPVWLAASTHPGEEEQIAQAHRQIAAAIPNLLTVIVPRHAVRGEQIAVMLSHQGEEVALRSRRDSIAASTAFYIADTMGELGLFYRLCPVAFIGGSLVPHGGQNLIEPARLGCAILSGPHTWNFAEVVEEFADAGALIEIKNASDMAERVTALLTDEARRGTLRENARRAAGRYEGLTARMADTLLTVIHPT